MNTSKFIIDEIVYDSLTHKYTKILNIICEKNMIIYYVDNQLHFSYRNEDELIKIEDIIGTS